MSSRSDLLDERERLRQETLQNRIAALLASLLGALPDWSEDSLGSYVTAAYPIVAGGQRTSAANGAGYALALAATQRPLRTMTLDVAGALVRSGVLITPDARSLPAPVLRARRLLNEGEPNDVALASAQSYAHELSSNDVRAAQRLGVGEGVTAAGMRVRGYRKVVSPTCCSWCSLVGSDRIYRSAESVPFHARDRCSVAPVLEGSTHG